jgi:hypothetical protein
MILFEALLHKHLISPRIISGCFAMRSSSILASFASFALLCLLLTAAAPARAQVFAVTADPDTLGPIPDGGAGGPGDYGLARIVEFEVSGTEGLVGGLTVEFSANHPFVSDLRVRVVAPNGLSHQLFAQSGITINSSDGFVTNLSSSETYSFSDQAANHWWELAGIEENGVPVDVDIPGGLARTVKSGGQSEPDEFPDVTSMNDTFLGAPMDGTWRLIFDDGWEDFVGEVTAASLILQFDAPDLVVTSSGDSGPGTLRQAMLDVGAGQTIGFSQSVFNTPTTIELNSALPEITQSLFIQGPGPDLLGIVRNSGAPAFSIFSTTDFEGNFAISGLRLAGGAALSGGAIGHRAQSLRASELDIHNNSGDLGGGVFIKDAEQALIINSSIRSNGNGSTEGSGIYASCDNGRECIVALVNSTVSGNDSSVSEPAAIGIQADRGARQALQLFNSTIVSDGAGVRLSALESGVSSGAVVDAFYVSNIFNNVDASIEIDAASVGVIQTRSFGGNLSNLDESDLFDEPTDQINTNPLLQPLSDNGGRSPTHALPAASPAIDAGLNSAGLADDQRGPGFPRVFGESADAGAFEFLPEDRIFGSRFELGADIITFDNVDFTPNEDFTGGSIRWVDGATCDCDASDFDFNIFGDPATLRFFWPRASAPEGGVTLDGSTYAVLSPGDRIGPQSDFIAGIQATATTAWSTPGNVTGYLGFRFEDDGQTKYGYALISTGPDGRPATLLSYAFDNSGAAITIP